MGQKVNPHGLRVGVIKEDEVGFTVLGISELAGKQVFGKKHGALMHPYKRVQRRLRQRLSLTAPGGETEVHPQPLEVKDHIPPAAVAGELLPDVGFKAAAGDGCVQDDGGTLDSPGVGRGKAEELSAFGALLPQ